MNGMNGTIKRLIRLRQQMFYADRRKEYLHLANAIKRNISAKQKFFNEKVKIFRKTEPKKWHSTVKRICGSSRNDSSFPDIPEVAGCKAPMAANSINSFLSKPCTALPPLDRTRLPAMCPCPPPSLVFPFEVHEELKRIKSCSSSGPDSIPSRIYKEFAPELTIPLTDIFNTSLMTGQVPDLWMTATVIPIPKKHPPKCLNDLRPISLTCLPCKILERIILKRMTNVANALHTSQYGNCKGISTTDYFLDFLHYVHLHLDAGRAVTSIFIDFCKAFDTVDHNLILKKLFLLDADPVLLLWVTSFLDHRTQKTRFNGADSEIVTLTCGVPQGTVLGPFLFSVMVDDDIQDQDHVQTFKYVDDKTLAVSHSKTGIPQPCVQA